MYALTRTHTHKQGKMITLMNMTGTRVERLTPVTSLSLLFRFGPEAQRSLAVSRVMKAWNLASKSVTGSYTLTDSTSGFPFPLVIPRELFSQHFAPFCCLLQFLKGSVSAGLLRESSLFQLVYNQRKQNGWLGISFY